MATGEKPHSPDSAKKDNSNSLTQHRQDRAAFREKSYGWLILNQRELVFEIISGGEDLNRLIWFFLKFTVLFSAIFGAILGVYAANLQILLAAWKAPLLILGTVTICLPALFTFNVLLGSKLSMKQTTGVLTITTYIMATVLISLAPIMLFFIISTQDKSFILLLNVAAFAIAGGFGVLMLWTCMDYLTVKSGYPPNKRIIQIWTLIYVFVGTQLAWILRPFIGNPGETVLFRNLEGNFYHAVLYTIIDLFK